ncbi:hypothetical protein [Saccharothrix algeriensis]|uniref:Uncharacterized protein n=1 Tax=Saccharothrix algeriensis TaxID=173560 RepID=A0A8T8HU97_9PSEU|nr:hypothetical protein [Saccharothrix algeriensis]MBM7813655.1 hypothetical protein [Saccharothrix algeriensis]QTR02133.1 hypothetical protein J7S33_23390 [Saccharothrix algeriensis]
MEWTPEALKAEIDYRQAALRADAAQARAHRRQRPAPKRAWWRRFGHRDDPQAADRRNGHRDAA